MARDSEPRLPYDRDFFSRLDASAVRSARVVVPLVIDLISPRSVVDIGCGTGGWLSVFSEHGVSDIIGVDGEYVERNSLRISPTQFVGADLRRSLRLGRQFDLVVCLEVAEHLPEASAPQLVSTLTALGPAILFSAAIQFQGGTDHLNEQWPDYWRSRFAALDFVLIDCLRDKVWSSPTIQPYIAQNLLLYVASDYLASHPPLQNELAKVNKPVRRIHPATFGTYSPRRFMARWSRGRGLMSGSS